MSLSLDNENMKIGMDSQMQISKQQVIEIQHLPHQLRRRYISITSFI
jgi:hypothetical protein